MLILATVWKISTFTAEVITNIVTIINRIADLNK